MAHPSVKIKRYFPSSSQMILETQKLHWTAAERTVNAGREGGGGYKKREDRCRMVEPLFPEIIRCSVMPEIVATIHTALYIYISNIEAKINTRHCVLQQYIMHSFIGITFLRTKANKNKRKTRFAPPYWISKLRYTGGWSTLKHFCVFSISKLDISEYVQ